MDPSLGAERGGRKIFEGGIDGLLAGLFIADLLEQEQGQAGKEERLFFATGLRDGVAAVRVDLVLRDGIETHARTPSS